MVRDANKNDLDEILQLYLYLHETSVPEDSQQLKNTWDNIINDKNHHLIVCEIDGKIVASCVCVIIPNQTLQGYLNEMENWDVIRISDETGITRNI